MARTHHKEIVSSLWAEMGCVLSLLSLHVQQNIERELNIYWLLRLKTSDLQVFGALKDSLTGDRKCKAACVSFINPLPVTDITNQFETDITNRSQHGFPALNLDAITEPVRAQSSKHYQWITER